ncbi:hypothetical protein OC940_20990 [Pseudomonas koreensis]|uniref:Uncharacterized protein n=1 Tax=Pseudomonas koreensis TaxID=198620 RepID=A0A9X3BD51_9PSED|nr:hypothetical protein [Pseudomonas koreensis]MCU7250295.1 hypothetical protein [Pseudomonas koreensis]
MFDFVGAFKRGVRAAKDLNKHHLEVEEVFHELSRKFLVATDGEFEIVRSSSFASGVSAALEVLSGAPPNSQTQTGGSIIIQSRSNANLNAKIANWIKHPKGFTFVLHFEQREIISKSQAELGAALEELLSAPVVGKAYLNLLSSLKNSRKEKEVVQNRPLRVTKEAATLAAEKPNVVKIAAKHAAKPTAARAAAKPAAKPAAGRAAAKPAAARAAAKPAAKPAAAKAAVEPAAKSAAAKAAAKPAAKPAAARAAAKPAAKPASAKAPKPAAAPVAKPAVPKQSDAPNADALGDGVNEMSPGTSQRVLNPGASPTT